MDKQNRRDVVLSIVFVTYDSARELRGALGSLQTQGSGVTSEVVVVDNASRDRAELQRACSEAGARLVQLGRNLGYGAAANRAARYARGRYLAVANPDLSFPRGAVDALVAFMEGHPEVGVVSPQMYYPDGTAQPSARRFPRLRYVLAGRRSLVVRILPRLALAREFLYGAIEPGTGPVGVEAVVGTFMVLRREAWDEVAGFDETYFLFAEDMDICHRLRQAGWEVVLHTDVPVYHFCGAVRRRHRSFSEYQRTKALCTFLTRGRSKLPRALIGFACGAYFVLGEIGRLMGVQESEPSWRRPGEPQ